MQLPPNVPPMRDSALAKADFPLMEKARALESAFLSEMLSHAGLGASEGEFSGGIGEEQFASYLRSEQADLMVQRGGIGLAEQLFHAMKGDAV